MAGLVLGVAIVEDSSLWIWLGFFLAWVSNLVLIVALIGFGVKLGREAADA